jgi:hypothetical protein
MANTPKTTRKEIKKGSTQLRAARNTDAGLPKTTAQKNSLKKASKKGLNRVVNGNIAAGRTPKEAAADSAQNKGIVKEAKSPSMKLKSAQQAKKKALAKKKSVSGRGY